MKDWFNIPSNSELADLGIGHAMFLQEYWKGEVGWTSDGSFVLSSHPNFGLWNTEHMKYPYGSSPTTEDLKSTILTVHKELENAEVDNRHIVIGSGITQLIVATLHAIKESMLERWYAASLIVTAKAPYFPHFPLMTRVAHNGLRWVPNRSNDIEIVTSPNNPDGNHYKYRPFATFVIHDLCYNWPQYNDIHKFDEEIMLFSLSKLTGHAGSRIGWGLFKDPELAHRVQHYIEVTTSGVSLDSQKRAMYLLNQMLLNKKYFFQFAKNKLKKRWREFRELTVALPIEIKNTKGMFAWCSVAAGDGAQLFQDWMKASVIGGIAFGCSNRYFRVNLGCSDEEWDRFRHA